VKAAVDLHIHSALSPCADDDMTPNNIINMAKIKGLDIIAITDHNSAGNIEAFVECAKEDGTLLVVPGMELETSEEVHLVCLFESVSSAIEYQEYVFKTMPDIKNNEEIFGRQLLLDKDDNIINKMDRLLLTASGITIEEACYTVRHAGGVVIPAHVDRDSYSVMSNLGFIPEDLDFTYIEVSKNFDEYLMQAEYMAQSEYIVKSKNGREYNQEEFTNQKKILGQSQYESLKNKYHIIKSSDAHYLGDILEREMFIDIRGLSVKDLLDALRGKCL